MSVTSTCCRRCGRLDWPHVCLPIPTATEPLEPIIAHERQGEITFQWVDTSDWIDYEGGASSGGENE